MALVPAQTAVANGLRGFIQMQNQQKFGLMLAIAAIIALLAGAWMWSQSPDYRVLYTNVSDRDGGAIIGALQQMNVPYKFSEGGGAILVPGNQVHEVRLRLASQGLPKGSLAGFELMENQKLGSSQFLEQVNYQRALEGELARSIQSLAAVQNARVHLALSKPSVFVREQQKPSASVLLNLFSGRSLDAAQVSAIVHLISSSVSDLPVKNVTVVDQSGSLLSSPGNATLNAQLDAGQLKYVQELEHNYVKRIEAILTPITGANNVRAQVTADVDFSQTERAEEIYKPNHTAPDPAAIRSQQSTESTTGGPQAVGGVPGALSNQPPAPASAPIAAAPGAAVNAPAGVPGSAAAAPSANSRKESTVNYEVDKTIKHVRQPVGGIKRLSVAVVVNYRKETDSAGKVTHTPLAAEQIAKINDLVKETMGYNKDRGDTLNVANSPFSVAEREVVPDVPFWKQPATLILAKEVGKHLLIAAAVLYLVLGVLRPLLKSLAQARPAPVLPEDALDSQAAAAVRRQGNAGYEQNLQMAKQLASQEPKIVANVVKDWVSGDER
ncbi:MAG: flagellar M-ring protein FliF [Gammaproteobacteria bacterium RIFCSPLOWO2_02_FULL_56_15]|nr:MAG: flagellar M-ring protein FliF [Gammaproteobacteria bacterium RIFCSPLOWO2_02_FULL_56_15]